MGSPCPAPNKGCEAHRLTAIINQIQIASDADQHLVNQGIVYDINSMPALGVITRSALQHHLPERLNDLLVHDVHTVPLVELRLVLRWL